MLGHVKADERMWVAGGASFDVRKSVRVPEMTSAFRAFAGKEAVRARGGGREDTGCARRQVGVVVAMQTPEPSEVGPAGSESELRSGW